VAVAIDRDIHEKGTMLHHRLPYADWRASHARLLPSVDRAVRGPGLAGCFQPAKHSKSGIPSLDRRYIRADSCHYLGAILRYSGKRSGEKNSATRR
jgi:hypothetical protein